MLAGRRRRFTTDEYHRMIEAGILTEDDRVELLAGEIREAAAVEGPHIACVIRLNHLFQRLLGSRALVSVQNPVVLSADSEPEPDLTLLAPRADFYADPKPQAGDVRLLVEVCDTTLRYDREVKLPLYAEAGIEECWLVDLRGERLEVCRRPSGRGYRQVRRSRRRETVSPVAFGDLEIPISDVLG